MSRDDLQSLDLTELLVHRGAALLLDRIVSWDDDGLVAEIRVAATHPFVAADGAPAVLALEYLAQAVAAHQGLLDRRAGRPICEGFLLGTRRFELHADTLPLAQGLTATVRRDFDFAAAFGRYDCRLLVAASGQCVAEGNLTVFQSPELVAGLKGVSG